MDDISIREKICAPEPKMVKSQTFSMSEQMKPDLEQLNKSDDPGNNIIKLNQTTSTIN